MDFMTVLSYVLAIIETGALIGGLVFLTKAIKEKKESPNRNTLLMQGIVYLAVYLALNILRRFVG